MGFFASELRIVLQVHAKSNDSPWDTLRQLGVHEEQIHRLQEATEDPVLIASLPQATIENLQRECDVSFLESARLHAATEADVFFRLLIYHNYRLDEAMNKANAVFAANLKDHLAPGERNASIYPTLFASPHTESHTAKSRRASIARPAFRSASLLEADVRAARSTRA
jgi:hypothetical protein